MFDPTLAMIRFGTGLGPRFTRPVGVDSMLAGLDGPDAMAADFPIAGFATTEPSHAALYWINRAEREARETPFAEAAAEARQALRRQIAVTRYQTHLATLARAVDAPMGLRERLTAFWTDHFTVARRSAETYHLISAYSEDAIRPHVTGSFAAMLRAVVLHPMMLMYLDQSRSIGPGSAVGQRRGAGLNENLARELLELHLLGVGGSYDQTDVRELAELLTGLTYQPERGMFYDPRRAEPGAETVLGLRFGAEPALDTVLAALDALAVLPQTGQHLARKMAVHFVSDRPDPDLVAAMATAFGPAGDLQAMTAAMLAHPAAWGADRVKVRQPQEFIVASLRALGITGDRVLAADRGTYNRIIARPMQIMGQTWQEPLGPDGWPEPAADWIIPQAMAGRISWAMQVPARLIAELPDPRAFVSAALADLAPPEVVFAAGAAENRAVGVGVILASPAFQRR